MTTSAIDNLDSSWKEWLDKQLDSNIESSKLAITLFENGLVDAASELIKKNNELEKTPYIDSSNNKIELPDKDVSIVMTIDKPNVTVIDDFLSPDECRRLIALTDQQLKAKKPLSTDDADMAHMLLERTNTQVELNKDSILVSSIEKRIAELLHWSIDDGDSIQAIKCKDGDSYSPHVDLLDNKIEPSIVTQKERSCIGIFLIVLSDGSSNASTVIPDVNMEMRLKAGSAIYLSDFIISPNINVDEQKANIEGFMPVTKGVKYLATKWLKEKPYV